MHVCGHYMYTILVCPGSFMSEAAEPFPVSVASGIIDIPESIVDNHQLLLYLLSNTLGYYTECNMF